MERLLDRIEPLGDHLGPILVQLPPDFEVDTEALDATLERFPAMSASSSSRATELVHARG
ncbi:MAG: DUF72 domain-containing protein [Chloroflexota bacterium]